MQGALVNLDQPENFSAALQVISDLDELIQATARILPRSKPWQRQLALDLATAERLIQILRLTISLKRSHDELVDASSALLRALQSAYTCANGGRTDADTKAALSLALGLARKVEKEFER